MGFFHSFCLIWNDRFGFHTFSYYILFSRLMHYSVASRVRIYFVPFLLAVIYLTIFKLTKQNFRCEVKTVHIINTFFVGIFHLICRVFVIVLCCIQRYLQDFHFDYNGFHLIHCRVHYQHQFFILLLTLLISKPKK